MQFRATHLVTIIITNMRLINLDMLKKKNNGSIHLFGEKKINGQAFKGNKSARLQEKPNQDNYRRL